MRCWPAGVLLILFFHANPSAAQWVERQFDIQAGWNAVFLDLEPYPSACEEQFAGYPIESVWSRRDDGSTIKVVGTIPQMLSEEKDLWRVYYPSGSPHSRITNLTYLEVGRAFLIEASESFTWTVKGRPLFIDRDWRKGSLNLVGFYVSPDSSATFEDFVSSDPETGGRRVYDLQQSGGWVEISNFSTPIVPGRGYLVEGEFKRGAGLVRAELGSGFLLEYPRGINTQTIHLECEKGETRVVTLTVSDSAEIPSVSPSLGQDPVEPIAGPIVARWRLTSHRSGSWKDFPAVIRMDGDATPEVDVRVAIDRLAMGEGSPDDWNQGIVTVTDDGGYRRDFGIRGQRLDLTGLWMGNVTLDAVSMPFEQGIEQTPEYTPAQADFRLLLHIDSQGEVKLIDEATQIWRPIDGHPDGGEVLLTTRAIPEDLESELLTGLASGAIPKPLHISTTNFDLRNADNEPVDWPMSGSFVPGATLEAKVILYDRNPTNPFHHKYHPDLTWFDNPLPSQVWDVTREIEIFIDPDESALEGEAGWGDDWLKATYQERISGIHKYDIAVSGKIYFRHLSRIGRLNAE